MSDELRRQLARRRYQCDLAAGRVAAGLDINEICERYRQALDQCLLGSKQTTPLPALPALPTRHFYGPAVTGIYWLRLTAENCPRGRVLSLFDFTFVVGVDVSDSSSAPGKLWGASIEVVRAMPGCVDVKVASRDSHACALILWESAWSWRSFHESLGLVRMVPLLAEKMTNRSVLIHDGSGPSSERQGGLSRIETTFEKDLDSATRSAFEKQVSGIINQLWGGTCEALTTGWIEHDAAVADFATEQDNAQVRNQCTHIMLYEDKGNQENRISTLVESVAQLAMSPDVKRKNTLWPTMTYHDTSGPASSESELMARPDAHNLAEALRFPIWRGKREVKLDDLEQADVRCHFCWPVPPRTVCQGLLYLPDCPVHFIRFGTLGNTRPEPYMVDIEWLTVRSTVGRGMRGIAKSLNDRIRQLPGYDSGFWVRVVESVPVFGLFTVWDSEQARASSLPEYREILERFLHTSRSLDSPPAHQTTPWMPQFGHRPVGFRDAGSRTEVVTFRMPQDTMRRDLFEQAFTGFQDIAAGMRQSGHAPNAVRLPDGGGWAPPESMTQRTGEEQEDVFTCFLSWMADEEGRNAWYKNLGNNMTVYDDIGRVMDELKILAEGGIESRTVTLQESF